MNEPSKKVEFYALSTCGWCARTRAWLDEHNVSYDITYMDTAAPDEKDAARSRALQFVSRLSFPLLIINDGEEVIQGYKPERYKEVLG